MAKKNAYQYNSLDRVHSLPALNIHNIVQHWNDIFNEQIKEYMLDEKQNFILGSYRKLPARDVKRALKEYRDAVANGRALKIPFSDFFNPKNGCNVWQYLDGALELKAQNHAAPPGENIVSEVLEKLQQYAHFNKTLEEDSQIRLWRDAYGNAAVDQALKKIKGE